eukprot:4163023-Prymnesium_polylepis.1
MKYPGRRKRSGKTRIRAHMHRLRLRMASYFRPKASWKSRLRRRAPPQSAAMSISDAECLVMIIGIVLIIMPPLIFMTHALAPQLH